MRKNQILFSICFLLILISLLSFSNEMSKERWKDEPDKTTTKIKVRANMEPIVLENKLVTNLRNLPLAGIDVDGSSTTTWWVSSTMGKNPDERYWLKFTIVVSKEDSTAIVYGYWGNPILGPHNQIPTPPSAPSINNMDWKAITNDKDGYGWDELNQIVKVDAAIYQYNSYRR